MDDTTILGGVLNPIGQTVKQTVKQIIKLPEEMAGDLGEQVGGKSAEASSAKATEDKAGETKQENKSDKQWQSDEERARFLRGLYGKTDASKNGQDPNKNVKQSDQKPTEFQEQIKYKSPEEQKKLIELRNQLHRDFYYDPTFNPVKNQEERPAEKVENEKKKEMMDLQKKEEKKPQPIAVVREQNKAEQFRGAAG